MNNLSTTVFLLNKIKSGDKTAAEQLVNIYYPILLKWAKGRLPFYRRDLTETSDIVHDALMSALNKIDHFNAERAGAFFAYLRTIIINKIHREVSQSARRPTAQAEELLNQSQLRHTDHIDTLLQYDRALSQLDEEQREAVIMRFEFGLSYDELAKLINKPSANAARMYVSRCLLNLAKTMS
ncbi:hypothetical protein MNBD_GAMMA02-1578 [hydrothermal vent metagenome]|uniref:RNA polymerase sigma-70 ECF-like HTH domain-containing protein n=1 Tax=hydrothermal vent metagenome TaxID=652676 RepID=A0A3B0VY85_9ZZZZ